MELIKANDTMTSREMAELMGKRPADVIRKIKSIVDKIEDKDWRVRNIALSQYDQEMPTGGTKKQSQYIMTQMGSLFIASRFDVNVHLKVQQRWKELEEGVQMELFKVPTTFKEALLLAAEQQDVIEHQAAKIEEDAPKVAFVDRYVESIDDYSMAEAAKVISNSGVKIGRNNLIKALKRYKVLDDNGVPYQRYMNFFSLKVGSYDDSKGKLHSVTTTIVKPNGMEWLVKKAEIGRFDQFQNI